MIVFPMDAKFESVQGKNNTYVLKFETDSDKHFFWIQVRFYLMKEKIDPVELTSKINDIINHQ